MSKKLIIKNMANTKSAKAKVREIHNKTEFNKSIKNRYRTFIKKVEQHIDNNDVDGAKGSLNTAQSEIMSAVSKKILHKNTASRKISRLSNKIKHLK